MGKRWRGALLATSLVLVGAAPAPKPTRWVSSWGAAQYIPTGDQLLRPDRLTNATLRQQVRVTLGGAAIRVRLSNAWGTEPLLVSAATLARASQPGTARITDPRPLLFAGRREVTIPAGGEITSDPLPLAIAAGETLAVSLYTPKAPDRLTSHPGARSASFIAAGDHSADPDLPTAERVERWYQLAGIEVQAPANAEAIVAIGDSITDGYGVKADTYTRWTDRLAQRLSASPATRHMALVNTGIGGNRVLLDGSGPNLVARFDRDVLSRSGVKQVLVLEGVNDLGVLTRDAPATLAAHRAVVTQLTTAFRTLADRAHAHGIRVIGATIMPFAGNTYYHPGPETEADRQQVNAFIRGSGVFDAVVDFDRITRDPAQPDRLLPAYDSGDHLHPSPAGYTAMGDAVPLDVFTAPTPPPPQPMLAITVDDMPAHGPLPAGLTRLSVAQQAIAAFRAHGVPAFGFVNGKFGEGVADADAVLDAWRAAGLPLGNHSYSHDNLAEKDLATFQADVVRNEPIIARRMTGADWHWFRYPFLSEGDTPAKRDDFRRFLASRRYKVAAVSSSFADYDFNPVYARCMAKENAAGVAQLEDIYLSAAATEAWRERARLNAAAGREVPQVLLMHIGAFTARMLPRLLDLYAAMGFRFVPLAEAERDPAYRNAVDLKRPGPSFPAPADRDPALRLPVADAGLCQ
ncbi:GDSL-type esterase/lipase family protein [Sphingomonas aerophila]|uniref:Chitooligosaccharide deacetylase n=1 Tax=Sphingomonas aerophila TaxID=1344948 RepID=A0A7W9BGB4_9SPHN|nr:GDSL-type esterase/lipase family protein [Sphingomonas aerophila]MBB5716686.1 lysophospholipase L1-like esterase [Sphingomonas aerophila]